MSYNITGWKIKEISDFIVPIEAVRNSGIVEKECINPADDRWSGELDAEDAKIIGKLDERTGELNVQNVYMRGEGSGYLYDKLIKVLKSSISGKLKFITVWEGGDTVVEIEINNGVYSQDMIMG